MTDQKKKLANLKFRKAELSDATAIAHLVNSAYRGESSQRGWTTEASFLEGQRTDAAAIEELIRRPGQFLLLAEIEGQLIGSAHLEKASDLKCYFGMFAIDPTLQSLGIGKVFLEKAEDLARTEFGSQIMEMTVITIRSELISWYERRGYQRTGEVRAFPYGNERFGIPLVDNLQLGVLEKRL